MPFPLVGGFKLIHHFIKGFRQFTDFVPGLDFMGAPGPGLPVDRPDGIRDPPDLQLTAVSTA